MIVIVIVSLALGLLLMAITYRHAIIIAKNEQTRVFFTSSFVFALAGGSMGILGVYFASTVLESLPFQAPYVSLILLWLLGLKTWFNTRRSKLSQAMFDIQETKTLLLLSLTNGFECFLAMSAIGFLGIDLWLAVGVQSLELLVFGLLGFFAGSRPNALHSVKLFFSGAALLYFIASLIALLFIVNPASAS